MTLQDLALAYELHQEGCCWKRIAQGLGGDPLLIAAKVYHLINRGIHKGLDGYQRQPGRRAIFNIEVIIKADSMRSNGWSWSGIGRELDVDHEKLRKSHRYALNAGMIGGKENAIQFAS